MLLDNLFSIYLRNAVRDVVAVAIILIDGSFGHSIVKRGDWCVCCFKHSDVHVLFVCQTFCAGVCNNKMI